MEKCTLHLMNDDVNHYTDVQAALMEICNLEDKAAEAFAIVAHLNDSFPVFDGDRNVVETMKQKLDELGIVTQITDVGQEPV